MYSEDKETTDHTENKRIVLCAANAYEQKYWLNPVFDKIPEGIRDELSICIVDYHPLVVI